MIFAFVYLGKTFDRLPRGVVRWVVMKLDVDKWLIETVMDMSTTILLVKI